MGAVHKFNLVFCIIFGNFAMFKFFETFCHKFREKLIYDQSPIKLISNLSLHTTFFNQSAFKKLIVTIIKLKLVRNPILNIEILSCGPFTIPCWRRRGQAIFPCSLLRFLCRILARIAWWCRCLSNWKFIRNQWKFSKKFSIKNLTLFVGTDHKQWEP